MGFGNDLMVMMIYHLIIDLWLNEYEYNAYVN